MALRAGGGGGSGQGSPSEQAGHRGFLGQGNHPHGTAMVDMGHYNLPTSTEWATPRVNFRANNGLGVIMRAQCRSSAVTHSPPWGEMLLAGEAVHVGGLACMGNICACHCILL